MQNNLDLAMRIGILTSGGDCPGINATLRGVIKSATHHYGMEVVGIKNGFQGLLTGEVMSLEGQAQGLLTLGGTILGTSRCKPFKKDPATGEDQSLQLKRTFIDLGLDCVVCIGGNGTMKTAYKMHRIGIPTIGIPKTIDNDIWGTDCTFGFDTAVSIATEAVDRLHSTASSHGRVMVMEVMGHKAGWIALYSGMAGGADVILIPELDYDLEHVYKAIRDRQAKGKSFTIIVVAEGLKTDGIHRPGEFLSLNVEKTLGLESRYTVLGYVQRGGSPTAYDRNLSTLIGGYATELIASRKFGQMVAVLGSNELTSLPLEEVAGKTKLVQPDNALLIQGRRMGICFG